MKYYAGIDAGSTYVKVAVLDEENKLTGCKTLPTGIDAGGTADKIITEILGNNNISRDDLDCTVATGYSRRIIDIADDTVTEIKAHAAGAVWSAPDGVEIKTLIDIGGQDSKVISINEEGDVVNFAMNDKCAAGTGRFLESLARVLELEVKDLGPMSLEANSPAAINNTCVVFAESEVISLVSRKTPREDIIAGIHDSLAKRVSAMARKSGITPGILLTGGGGLNCGIAASLEKELMNEVHVPDYPQFNGAIGAAIIGRDDLW